MVNRILEQQQPLCATLIQIRKPELMPTDNEISIMEAFVEVMKPIAQITETIGGEKRVTLSAVRPLIYKLLNKYLKITLADSHVKREIKKAIKTDLENRYSDPQIEELLNKVCFLDPHFKSLSFLSEQEKKYVMLLVEEEATGIRESASKAVQSCEAEDGPQKKKPKRAFSLY